jgi:glyoxylase-like metal-dependent hydrolase (beta-lactamase superfamily II)
MSTGIDKDDWSDSFDRMFADGDTFGIGQLQVKVLHLPGHTPDHVGYEIGRNVFTGDSIFNPDLGSARCDFPEGSAEALWSSMQRLLSLPPDYKLYTGHDYPPADRSTEEGVGKPRPYATVQEHKSSNKHVKDGTSESTFVEWRKTRDAGLSEPKLMNQAMQFNIRAGKMPKKSATGDRLVHVPLKLPSSLVAL